MSTYTETQTQPISVEDLAEKESCIHKIIKIIEGIRLPSGTDDWVDVRTQKAIEQGVRTIQLKLDNRVLLLREQDSIRQVTTSGTPLVQLQSWLAVLSP